MTLNRKEYELVYDALKNYHVYMDKDQRIMAEQILDDLFYPEFDKLSNDDSEINTDWQPDDTFDEIVKDAEEALANEPEINGVRSLNFR